MFVTHESGKLPNLFGNTQPGSHWSFVELSVFAPFLFVKYAFETEEGEFNQMILLRGPEELLRLKLVDNIKVVEGYLLSPDYINTREEWELAQFSEILEAELQEDDLKSKVTRYKLCNGEEITINYSSLKITDQTEFRTSFSFNE